MLYACREAQTGVWFTRPPLVAYVVPLPRVAS
jgi:hypothetical protein